MERVGIPPPSFQTGEPVSFPQGFLPSASGEPTPYCDLEKSKGIGNKRQKRRFKTLFTTGSRAVNWTPVWVHTHHVFYPSSPVFCQFITYFAIQTWCHCSLFRLSLHTDTFSPRSSEPHFRCPYVVFLSLLSTHDSLTKAILGQLWFCTF